MQPTELTLAQMQPSQECWVVAAAESKPLVQSRLYALGIYPGVSVRLLRFAPSGDPIQVRVGGTLLSIRKQEAAEISVTSVSMASP